VLAGHSANTQVDRVVVANVKGNNAVSLALNGVCGYARVHATLPFRSGSYRTPNITDPERQCLDANQSGFRKGGPLAGC
jgi:hypothetical protein